MACLSLGCTLLSGLVVGATQGLAPDLPTFTHPRGYVAYRAEPTPVIDGRLDDPTWQAVPWTEEFVDIEGDHMPTPRYATRAKLLWDDEYLYVGAHLEEPHVWATLTERDSVIFHDNDFEVFIDPDGDNHQYYEIEVNALNTVWDLRLVKPYREGGPALDAWDIAGLRTAVYVDGTLNDSRDEDRYWSVEMAFPWTALAEYSQVPSPPAPGDQWRINFSRVEWDTVIEGIDYIKVTGRPEHNWVWSPQGTIDMHRPETWGYVQFSSAAPGSDLFRPDPTYPGRVLLHRIYYAQRSYREAHGHWAGSLDALGLAYLSHESVVSGPVLELADLDGWFASVVVQADEGSVRLRIRADALLTAVREF